MREISDQELLTLNIEDDAEYEDSRGLLHRQNDRWADFQQRRIQDVEAALKNIEAARRGTGIRRPTWWLLWEPPVLPPQRPLHQQGILSFDQNTEFSDVHSYGHSYGRPILDRYDMYMDFHPTDVSAACIRTRIHGHSYRPDYVVVRMLTPPPYGYWLPAFADMGA